MVRFTLKDGKTSASIRMDMQAGERINEIARTAKEYWGPDREVLVKGYMLLDSAATIGETLHDGDVVEAIPDPMVPYRRVDYQTGS